MDRQKDTSKAKEISQFIDEDVGLGGKRGKQRQGEKRAETGQVGPETQVSEQKPLK